MKFNYDQSTDSLYIHFVESAGADTIIINDNVVADIDVDGRLVGIDIQHASQQSDLGNFIVDGLNPILMINK
jgi:uncharacterized protein YuzE